MINQPSAIAGPMPAASTVPSAAPSSGVEIEAGWPGGLRKGRGI